MADKSFVVDMTQRQSSRGTHQVRPSSSDLEPLHHRPITDRSSPKLRDCRSPKGAPQSDPLNQKKLGARIVNLESQLGQAQEELKNLKDYIKDEVSEDFVTDQTEADQNGPKIDIDDKPVRGTRLLAEIYERAEVVVVEPCCFEEVETQQGWKQAMLNEMSMIDKNQTWDLVPRPINKKVIGVKRHKKQPRSRPSNTSHADEVLKIKLEDQAAGISPDEVYAAYREADQAIPSAHEVCMQMLKHITAIVLTD
ncbi:interactor of constitutive active ROPs 4-like [Gossypium arboreum]|uniref:interactor of constitutive active ROPs 4-like n=1 Tax=Gossypium arboreum TaxID=29729 RepID=UPI0008195AC3|nr:interactor of constitutive active ROPs 4-like [Gossypium arboreum]